MIKLLPLILYISYMEYDFPVLASSIVAFGAYLSRNGLTHTLIGYNRKKVLFDLALVAGPLLLIGVNLCVKSIYIKVLLVLPPFLYLLKSCKTSSKNTNPSN